MTSPGGNGVDQAGVDGLQGGFEFALDDAVKLKARGQAQRVVGEADGDGIQRQPLFGVTTPPGVCVRIMKL